MAHMDLISAKFIFYFNRSDHNCPSLRFGNVRSDGKYDDKASNDERTSNECDENDAAPAGRKFSHDDIMLALEVPVEAKEQCYDANREERRS